MIVGVMKDYKLRDLRASHTLDYHQRNLSSNSQVHPLYMSVGVMKD